MTCHATLADDGRLACTRTDAHEPHRGCTYESTSAGDDRHQRTPRGDES